MEYTVGELATYVIVKILISVFVNRDGDASQ